MTRNPSEVGHTDALSSEQIHGLLATYYSLRGDSASMKVEMLRAAHQCMLGDKHILLSSEDPRRAQEDIMVLCGLLGLDLNRLLHGGGPRIFPSYLYDELLTLQVCGPP